MSEVLGRSQKQLVILENMSQKSLTEFFHPRKRQRPETLKNEPAKSVLSKGLDAPVKKAKRLKRDIAEPSSAGNGVQFHMSKEQVLKSLKSQSDVDSHSKSPAKHAHLVRLKEKLTDFKTASQTLRDFKAGSDALGATKTDCGVFSAQEPKATSASRPHNSTQTFVTAKSVQRNLFGGSDDKPAPQKEKLADSAPRPGVAPGMSPQKMKESLMKCNNIGQLKERLAGYNNAKQKLKDFQAAKETLSAKDQISKPKQTLEFEITSPVKTPKKSIASPSPKKTPAYERFQHLLHDTPSTLSLPYKYRFLKEAFHCLDTVASFLHNRKEIITFKKLKSSVQEMLTKNFTEAQLAQIKTVFPFAYIFRREKNLPNHKVTPNNKNKWQLTVEVNTNYESDMKSPAPAAESVGSAPRSSVEYRKLTPGMLLQRGRIFHAALVDLVLQHHQEFLLQLDPPFTVDPARITRWHPQFPLEAVPDVPAAELPQPPADETGGTARDVLERARHIVSKYPHLRETLEAVAGPAPEAAPSEPQPGPSGAQPAAPPAGAGRLPAGLLERIRAREAARQQRLMTRTPAESRRLNMLARLPQLVRSLRATFVTERRAALPLETVMTRLSDSSRGLAECDDLRKHVELLAEEAPQFVQIVQLKLGTFVKLVKDVDVNAVVASLEKKLEKQ
ncbi:DNA replication factor Cdt1-like isoform X2 [Amphibalanus amphitrite]|uniref:DNA replication factor Cdt1-like isoform X2 n=1 Tax=Amphibalanus amphitrite TaxID=1232801 RepID=UPI001C91A347|nr:DNA replication factor Cdt1-like isoform X2 [Amphibalanus amphitrite]